jgi:hypothetical protein
MSRVIHSRHQWNEHLKQEYPGVHFVENGGHPPGINAITGGVLVGRFFSARTPPFGVVFNQPRSCGGRN